MLVLGVALFGKSPYKRVVVNGLVLAEDGQKMAKSKKNYPDLTLVVNRYGADALRYFLMSSPLVKAQDFSFSEKGVDEVVKKHIGRLNNVLTFYEMYSVDDVAEKKSDDSLDMWIMNRLNELNRDITENLDKYEIDRACRPIADFIDDLSTWYIRRSRNRFKGGSGSDDKINALATTRKVLLELSKLMAPFMPFISEDIYLRLRGGKESVHLEEWPEYGKPDKKILENMREVRRLVSLGLEARMKAEINVRQPLAKLATKIKFDKNLAPLIKDEVNVKEVAYDANQNEEVILDTNITSELKEEGMMRELIRSIQDLRKEKGFSIKDKAILTIEASTDFIDLVKNNKDFISNTTQTGEIIYKVVPSGACIISIQQKPL